MQHIKKFSTPFSLVSTFSSLPPPFWFLASESSPNVFHLHLGLVPLPWAPVIWFLSLKELCFGAIWIILCVETNYLSLAHENLLLILRWTQPEQHKSKEILPDQLEVVQPPVMV